MTAPSPAKKRNPWLIGCAALVGLLLICGVVGSFTRSKQPAGGAVPSATPRSAIAEQPTAQSTDTPKPTVREEPTRTPRPTPVPIPTSTPRPPGTGFRGGTDAKPVYFGEGRLREVDPPWYPCKEGEIKGSQDSKIYHVPSGAFYARTFDGVQCFANAADAQAAGYRESER